MVAEKVFVREETRSLERERTQFFTITKCHFEALTAFLSEACRSDILLINKILRQHRVLIVPLHLSVRVETGCD